MNNQMIQSQPTVLKSKPPKPSLWYKYIMIIKYIVKIFTVIHQYENSYLILTQLLYQLINHQIDHQYLMLIINDLILLSLSIGNTD